MSKKNVCKDPVDTVYRYYFENENAVYVGRTIYLELRDHQHRTREKDTVYKFAKEFNTEIPKIEVLEEGLTVLQGAEREDYWEKYYRNKGFTIINKQPCGSLGHMCKKWSKEKCFEEGKKYKTRGEFQKNNVGAYESARKNKWFGEMDWFEKPKERKPRGYWQNKENVINEARKYKTRSEFKFLSQRAYESARKNKWIDEMIWLNNDNGKHPKGYWKNEKNIMHEAKKYSNKEEFKEKNLTAFLMSYRYGFNEKMEWLIKQKQHKKGYWTYKHIEEEALKYNTKTEFFKGNQTAYRAALKLGIIDDFFLNNYIQY